MSFTATEKRQLLDTLKYKNESKEFNSFFKTNLKVKTFWNILDRKRTAYNHFNKYLGKYFEDFSKEINNSKQYSLLNFCEDFKKQQLKKIANMTITKEKKTCESNHIFYAYFSGGIKKTVIDELFVYATHANSKIYRILSESRQFKTMEREILNNQVL